MKPIGINKVKIGKQTIFDVGPRISSSFSGIFSNDIDVLVNNGPLSPTQIGIIGDIEELYPILNSKVGIENDFNTKMKIIFNIVTSYFGNFDSVSERANNYPEESDEKGRISDLKGKNAAMCVERAMVSQNLIKALGINSFYKCSMILNEGHSEAHAYNIVEYDGHYYIFDSTMPKLENDEITPIIAEISKEVFDEIILENEKIGYPVCVSYFNAFRNVEKHIIYGSWSNREPYIVEQQKGKTL